jgi:hypothetical protein
VGLVGSRRDEPVHPLKVETRVRVPLGLLGQRSFLTFQRTIAKNAANSSGDGARPVPARSTDEILPTMAAFERRTTFLLAAICGVDSFGSKP